MKYIVIKTTVSVLFVCVNCLFLGNSGITANVSCQNIAKILQLPPNTKVSRKQQRNAKEIYIHCDKGYLFSPRKSKAVIRCNNGVITTPIPSCRGCDPPPIVKNGTRNFSRLSVGAKAKYSCDVGFTLVGRRQLRCGRNLKWSGRVNPYCQRNKCSVSKNFRLTNGNVTTTDPLYHELSTLSFECNEGYELRGEEDLVCRDNNWSGHFPSCRKKRCPYPGHPINGRKFGNSYYIGSTVEFFCNSGFRLYGSPKRTCQTDQTWNGTLTTCDDGRYYCRDPGIPIGVYRSGRKVAYDMHAIVKYSCRSGFRLEGSNTRTCARNKTWTGTQPRCVDVNFREFPSINETLAHFQESFVNSLLQTTCSGTNSSCPKTDPRARSLKLKYKEGLDLIFVLDTSSSIHEKNFEIAKDFIINIVKIFGASRSADGTQIACVTYGTTISEEFNFGADSVNTEAKAIGRIGRIRYRGGGTATRLALDVVRESILPSGRSKRGSTTAIFLVTDGNSNIGGKPRKAAELLKKTEKLEIYVVGIGTRIRHQSLRDLASGETLEKKEEHIFEVENFGKLKKIKKWIAEMPVKDYSKCGRAYYIPVDARTRVVGGRMSTRTDWPWVVQLIIKAGEERCGGTLIDNEFILTAAHCLNNVQRPQQVVVSFEDKKQIVNTVEKYAVHPNYNKKNFANDVALLKIPKLERFNRRQQTLCLPRGINTNNLTSVPNSLYALGWGGTKHVIRGGFPDQKDMSKDLKQVELPFAEDKECAENIKKKLDSGLTDWYFNGTTQFCAADKTGKNDTCGGDSGGPAMVFTQDESGRYRWLQVGLVSWGNGCAQNNEYGYYTKVSPFLHWIDKAMRELRG